MAKITYIFIILLFMNLALVQSLNDCTKYGCKTNSGSGQVVIIANATINQTFYSINNSFFNASYATYPYVNEVVLGNASGGSMDYPYVNENILGNKTDLYINLTDFVLANYIRLNNATINAGIPFWYNMSDGSYNASYNIWAYNQTIPSLTAIQNMYIGNNSLWLGTYNLTYDGFTSINNQSIWAGINSALAGANSSWNQSRALELLVPYTGATGNLNLNMKNLTNVMIINSMNTTATRQGSFAMGRITSPSNSINATNLGAWVGGAIRGLNDGVIVADSYILASGIGSFSHGAITGSASTNASIIASGSGATALGGVSSKNGTLSAVGGGTTVLGYIVGTNSLISATDLGGLVHGFIDGGDTNYIIASGKGAMIHGYIPSTSSNSSIIASGIGSFIVGLPNMSVSGDGSIALGQNINISGANSMAIGLGSPIMQHINNSRVFAVMTGAVGINITNPNTTFHVDGTGRFSKNLGLTNVSLGLNSGESNYTVYINSTGCKIETLAGVVREWTCP